MRWDQLCRLAKELPEVVEDAWYGTPALKVRGRGFVRLKEDGKSVVFLLDSVDEQEFLVEARPEIYFITDHYRGWPSVLARLSALRVPECRLRLAQAWRRKAPPALIRSAEARRVEAPGRPRRRPGPARGGRTRRPPAASRRA